MTTTSTASRSLTRAKSVAPTLLWSIGSTTRRARSITARLERRLGEAAHADAELGEAAHAEERRAEREALEVLERQVAGDRAVDAAQLAAEQHAVDARPRPRARWRRRGCWSAPRGAGCPAAGEPPRDRLDRVPLSRNTESPSRSSCTHASAIDLLVRAMRFLALRELAIDVGVHRERAAVRALEQPALLQRAQVLADRRLGDAEGLRQLADPRATAHGDTSSAIRA